LSTQSNANYMKQYIAFLLLIITGLTLSAQSLDEIKQRGTINIAFTQSSKNTVNFLLAEEFGKFLGLEVNKVDISWEETFSKDGELPADYQTNPKVSYTPDALVKADIVCGTMYLMDWRKKFFDYAGITQISDLLIIRKNSKEVKSYQDLKGLRIAFLENSAYESDIERINKQIGGGIILLKTKSEEESLELLNQGKADGLVAVSYLALSYLKKNVTTFRLAFPVAEPQNVGWVIRNGNSDLAQEISNFFETIEGNGRLDALFREKYQTDYSTYLKIINSYAQSQQGGGGGDFDEILESGKITFALRDREMVYHPYGQKQFSHYLAEKFAEYLGLQYEIVITNEFSDYFENDKGVIIEDSAYMPKWFESFDVACDLIAPIDWRLKKVDIIDYMPNAKVVIGRKNTKITSVNDLRNLRGVTSKGSSYESALMDNGVKNYYYKEGDLFFNDLLSKKADYAISNLSVYTLADYPELEAKFIMGEIEKMGWAIKKNQPKLRQKILEFFEYAEKNGIFDEYFKRQTGMTMQSAQNYLTVLHETYQEGNFPFVFYGMEDGLPQENVLSVFQDKDGYMWFGTNAGASKYNGRSWQTYTTDNGLINNAIYNIAQDKNGIIYFATLNGVSSLNTKTQKIRNYFENKAIKEIYIDESGEKWFFGENGIFKIAENGKEYHLNKEIAGLPRNVHAFGKNPLSSQYIIGASTGLFMLSGSEVSKISDEYCHYAFFDTDGNLWASMQSGIYYTAKKDIKKKTLELQINSTLNIPKNSIIRRILQTEDESVWLISDYKVYQILTLKQKPIVYDENIGLKRYRILSFLRDNENNMWFGLSGGLQKLNNKSLRTLFPNQLNSYINSVYQDSDGKMWFGMNNDIYFFNEGLTNFTAQLPTDNKTFVSEVIPESGTIIIANTEAMYLVNQKTGKIVKERKFANPLLHLKDIYISPANEIFLLSGVNGVVYYFANFDAEPMPVENHASRLVLQLEDFRGYTIGANSTGLVVFKNESFWQLRNTNYPVWSICKDDLTDIKTGKSESILWVGTENGLAYYDNDSIRYIANPEFKKVVIIAITPAEDHNRLWLGTNKGVFYYNKITQEIEFIVDSRDGLFGNEIATDGLYLDGRGMLWISTYHGIATYDIKKRKSEKTTPICKIESITLNGEKMTSLPQTLSYSQRNLVFEISGLSFKDENSVEYEYYLQGAGKEYPSYRGRDNIARYQNLPPGKYIFKYRTKGKDGIWSYYQSVDFEIKKPFYLTWWFVIIAVAALILSVWQVFKWRIKILQHRNEMLEQTIAERMAEIVEKNEELQQQKEEIEAQRDAATKTRDEIAHKNKEIHDSIMYAQRIQNAILPPQSLISHSLPENFILFKPRDIVSGDYYWVAQRDGYTYFAAADCTGHGVPGAFMSMLGVSFLNEILKVSEKPPLAGVVLDKLRQKVIEALHQTGETHEAKDGMDIALCVIPPDKKIVQFAGAFNPLYVVRDNEIIVVEPDRMPIGIYEYEEDKKDFTTNYFEAKPGDTLYVFSDGYADQFGGPNGKKFMVGRFKKALTKAQELPMSAQRQYLDDLIERWMYGVSDQIDDILVIGVKITE